MAGRLGSNFAPFEKTTQRIRSLFFVRVYVLRVVYGEAYVRTHSHISQCLYRFPLSASAAVPSCCCSCCCCSQASCPQQLGRCYSRPYVRIRSNIKVTKGDKYDVSLTPSIVILCIHTVVLFLTLFRSFCCLGLIQSSFFKDNYVQLETAYLSTYLVFGSGNVF